MNAALKRKPIAPTPLTMNLIQAARYLGVSRERLRQLADQGIVKRFRWGGRGDWAYSSKQLEDVVQKLTEDSNVNGKD